MLLCYAREAMRCGRLIDHATRTHTLPLSLPLSLYSANRVLTIHFSETNTHAHSWDALLNSGVTDSETVFAREAMRCGRLVDANRQLTWRWTGFNYGFDLLVCRVRVSVYFSAHGDNL